MMVFLLAPLLAAWLRRAADASGRRRRLARRRVAVDAGGVDAFDAFLGRPTPYLAAWAGCVAFRFGKTSEPDGRDRGDGGSSRPSPVLLLLP